jgi:hypothetical protein
MKILFINNWMHPKNENALMSYKNIQFTIIKGEHELGNYNLCDFDCVYSPCLPINVCNYPNTKFIFGPHFSIFPEEKIGIIKGNNSVYIQPSNWVKQLWSDNTKYAHISRGLTIKTLPFGVDSDKYCKNNNIVEKQQVFIYFKQRNPSELELIKNYLDKKNIIYKIFNYNERYEENDYLNYLHNSSYGIWVGRHESQGFALEEALSCDVPLLVWNVKSMNQEYGSSYDDIPGSSIPYWDERCGEYFTDIDDLEHLHTKLLNNIHNYKPREFILENLSIEVCENKLFNLINNINL